MSFEDKLTRGLHCKACNRSLGVSQLDPELCGTCLETVADYNKDIIDAQTNEEFIELLEGAEDV